MQYNGLHLTKEKAMTSEPWSGERAGVLETAQELDRLGLVAGASGNVSVLIPGEPPLVAITPSRVNYRSMTAADIPVIDFDYEPVYGDLAPSFETALHLAVYRSRRDARAVVHTHSVYATACAVAGIEIPAVIDEVAVTVGGAVRVAPYAPPGTQELADKAVETLDGRSAALISNHGLVTLGRDLETAMDVAVLVERAAHICLLTQLLGMQRPLPQEVLAVEEGLFRMRLSVEASQ